MCVCVSLGTNSVCGLLMGWAFKTAGDHTKSGYKTVNALISYRFGFINKWFKCTIISSSITIVTNSIQQECASSWQALKQIDAVIFYLDLNSNVYLLTPDRSLSVNYP